MTIATLGLDLGKVWIFLVGLDHDGRIVLQRRVRRARLPTVTANLLLMFPRKSGHRVTRPEALPVRG